MKRAAGADQPDQPIEAVDRVDDPLTGRKISKFVGIGAGAGAGGATGAAIGTAVGGPAGAAIGGALGAVVGGLTGAAASEAIDPATETGYWRERHATRPYAEVAGWEAFEPAYRLGWESRANYPDSDWWDVEDRIGAKWREMRSESDLAWEDARPAVRDAWDRLSSWFDGDDEDRYWAASYRTRPYVGEGDAYELYAPAYRFGFEAKRRHTRLQWEEAEERLEQEWRERAPARPLDWEKAKPAIYDGWHRVEESLPAELARQER